MMRYLQKQRKSVISGIGFRRISALLLGLLILFSLAMPPGDIRDTGRGAGAVAVVRAWEYEIQDTYAKTGATATISMPSAPEVDERLTTRELFGVREVRAVDQRTAFRYRYLSQIRLFVWYMITGLLLLPELFRQYYGDGRIKQRELVPRSRMIVSYVKRADGKKNGIVSSIK